MPRHSLAPPPVRPGINVPLTAIPDGARLTSRKEIRSFVERVEQLEEEIAGLNEGKKEVFAEAKGEGFDVKILKEIIKLRKLDQEERDEHETLLDVYMRAMDGAEPESEPEMKQAA